MRYVMSLIIINLALVSSVILKIKTPKKETVKVFPNIVDADFETLDLTGFQYEINYVDNLKAKDTVVKTIPEGDSLIMDNQIIKIYLSTGIYQEEYRDLVNTHYVDNILYLQSLKEKYQIKVKVNYRESNELSDGLIIYVNLSGKINLNDCLELTVIKNEQTIIMPDFTGMYYQNVLAFANEYQIEVKFYYVSSFVASGMVVSQSIAPGTKVLKGGTYLEIYLEE